MPIIRPSSDLRQKYNEISTLCKETKEPVNITVNGRADTTIISTEVFDEMVARIELFSLITMGINDVEEGRVVSKEEAKSKVLDSLGRKYDWKI